MVSKASSTEQYHDLHPESLRAYAGVITLGQKTRLNPILKASFKRISLGGCRALRQPTQLLR